MPREELPAFGAMLTHYRVAVGLTQEQLAERAEMSARGISDLERGVRTRPQLLTLRRLADGLELSGDDRAAFERAAQAPARSADRWRRRGFVLSPPATWTRSETDGNESRARLSEKARPLVRGTARTRRLLTVAVGIAIGTAVLAGLWVHGVAGSPRPAKESRIDAYLASLAAHSKLNGTVFVAQRGKVLVDGGYGLANRKVGIVNGPATAYPVDGNTLVLSIVAVVRLEEQGKLRGGDRLCAYLSHCPPSWKQLTVQMLLDGTAGLSDYQWGNPGRTTSDSLATCQAEAVLFAPRTRRDYHNCSVIVLGAVIERVTGKPWEAAVRQLIFRPAGMAHTGRLAASLTPPTLARGYSESGSAAANVYNDYFQLYTTAPDIYKYDTAFFGGKLISHRSVAEMVMARATAAPVGAGIDQGRLGYGYAVGALAGHRVIIANGDVYAFSDINLWFPREGVAVVVISNDDQTNVHDVAVQLSRLVLPRTSPAPGIASPIAVSQSKVVRGVVRVPNGFSAAFGGRALWVGGDQTGLVTRVDLSTGKIVARIRVNDPATRPGLIDAGIVMVASGDGQIWASDRVHKAVVRIDPRSNKITARVRIGIEPFGLEIAGTTLWVDDSLQDEPGLNTIVRVNLRNDRVAATISNATTNLGEPYLDLAATFDAVWYADWSSRTVKRLNPAANKVVATIHAGLQPGWVAVGQASVWTVNHYSNLVTRINPAINKVIAKIPLNGYPTSASVDEDAGGGVTVGEGSVWTFAGSANRTLVRIDPRTNRVTASVTFPDSVWLPEHAVAGGSVWAASGSGETWRLYRIDPRAMR